MGLRLVVSLRLATGLRPLTKMRLVKKLRLVRKEEAGAGDNFSPDLLVDEDTTLLGFNAFKMFNTTFREGFIALKTMDRKPVVFKSDKAGKGGVVGFTTSWLFQ
jgi:hypothetical protein